MRRLRHARGFTLVELLIVVAIIGLLASILIPNLIDALQKAKQKRTLVDMKGVGIAWMSWLTDQTGAASAGSVKSYDRTGFLSVSYVEMVAYLRPSDHFFYAQVVPQFDGWIQPLRYERSTQVNDQILICAPCRDGVYETCGQTLIPAGGFLTTNYDMDIVWADGYFVRWPRGITSN